MKSSQEILKLLQAAKTLKVKVAVTDIDGILRGKYIHMDKFTSALDDGFGFCNVVFGWDSGDVCYDNVTYTGWHTGYPDAKVQLDPSTFRRIPWDNDAPFLLGDFVDEKNKPLSVCPRTFKKSHCPNKIRHKVKSYLWS